MCYIDGQKNQYSDITIIPYSECEKLLGKSPLIWFLSYRSSWNGLSRFISCALHEFLLRLATISGFLRRHGNKVSSVALLWHWWSTSYVPVSQRHPVLPSSICVWLVVQRQMRPQLGSICNQQPALWDTEGGPHTATQTHHQRTSAEHIRMNECIHSGQQR
jgi:hypothetical protein